jgi:hypothetical protein
MAYINFDPQDYFNTKLYTGTGATQAITGVGFQPDMVWIKNRSATTNHQINDAVRGVNKQLAPNNTNAEETNTGELTAFGSDGFTVGSGGTLNGNGDGIVSWNWKANGSGVSNTDGSITSTVSASTTSGFSIVSFNGQTGTVGHGLGVKPSMIILKCRAISNNWVIQHKGLTGGMDENVVIFTTSAEIGVATAEPTTSVFTVNNGIAENNDNIAYCFAEKKGFSKFGSYTGNGNADGPFIYTGFKPAWFLLKRYDSGSSANWEIYDTTRDTYNEAVKRLAPSLSDAEATNFALGDILSNGVKIRQTDQTWNASGGTYIYMAFAEQPLINSLGNPATAR